MVIYPQLLVLEVTSKVDFAPPLEWEMVLQHLECFNNLEGIKEDNSTYFYLSFLNGCLVVAPIT
jgi:hypothetical protein